MPEECQEAGDLKRMLLEGLIRQEIQKERERIIRLIEDEQAFLSAGDKRMLAEKIREGS